jgi:cytochrome c biogenesis protein CcmG/thiol:disulfide interchange protein DsbE
LEGLVSDPESQLPHSRAQSWWAALATALLVVLGGAFLLRPNPEPSEARLASSDLMPAAGEQAADFSVDLLDRDEFSLSDHLATDGRPVVLNFWASWCIPCREEMPTLDEAARRHPEVLFLGVAVEDDPAAARAFAEEVRVSYPLAVDESGIVLARYPIFGLPTTWFIAPDGSIAGQVSGLVTESYLEERLAEFFG